MGADGSAGASEAPWRSAAAQVFVDDLGSPELAEGDGHHLTRVLRLEQGSSVCAADGVGGWRLCRLGSSGALEPDGDVRRQAALAPSLSVGFSPVKGDRPEWVVQKLTEVGIDRVVILRTQRSIVRWSSERAERQIAKLTRVAHEAARQCRRLWLPGLEFAPSGVLPQDGVLADAGGRALSGDDHLILVGPEGGWTNEERDGRSTVALAANILRSETAALVAGAAMASLRLGLAEPGLA